MQGKKEMTLSLIFVVTTKGKVGHIRRVGSGIDISDSRGSTGSRKNESPFSKTMQLPHG